MTDAPGWPDEAREAVARAISAADQVVPPGWEGWLQEADAALAALAPFLTEKIAERERAAWMPQENATRNEILEALSREIIKRQQAEDAAAIAPFLAAREAAAYHRGAEAMGEVAAQIATDQTSDAPMPGDWNDACATLALAIRALPIPEDKP